MLKKVTKEDPFQKPLKPEDVIKTEVELGKGTYARVFEIEYCKAHFAAKRLRFSFVKNASQNCIKMFAKKFTDESRFQNQCRHPNIVKFVGIYYGEEEDMVESAGSREWFRFAKNMPRIPTIVMEKMECTLFELVNRGDENNLDRRVSILQDVSRGVYFLHTQDPPLMHGDLNPHNVLINTTPSLQAKISHIVAVRDQEHTLGLVEFMPPEVLIGLPTYSQKVDVFSFGGVVLFAVTGEWPLPIAKIKFDYKTGNPVLLSEVNRRQQYLKKMRGGAELLRSLVKECLDNDPAIRPNIGNMCKNVEVIQRKLKVGSYPDNEFPMEGLPLEQQLQQKDQQLHEKDQQLNEKDQQLQKNYDQMRRDNQHIAELQRNIEALQKPTWVVRRNDIKVFEDKELGRGAYGVVNEATFHGCRVAVKFLHDIIMSPYYQGLFEREINMAARCRHPNLIQFIGASNEGQLFILTELMHTSLRKILQQGQLHSSQIIPILLGVAYGLNYLHHSIPDPILHRDVSSANVLLNPLPDNQWHPKLSDFGSTNFMLDSNTVNVGNVFYAAPEVAQGPFTPAMDVFSFGILTYEMCSKEFPSKKLNPTRMNYVKWEGTEAKLISLIQKCISDEIDDRSTMDDVIYRLNV